MSINPVLGAALHLLQYLSNAALVKARAYSSTLPVFMLALYRRSATKGRHQNHQNETEKHKEAGKQNMMIGIQIE